MSLAPSLDEAKKTRISTPHMMEYFSKGYVIFNDEGEIGKLCTENIYRNLPSNQTFAVLRSVASSLCQSLTYKLVFCFEILRIKKIALPKLKCFISSFKVTKNNYLGMIRTQNQ